MTVKSGVRVIITVFLLFSIAAVCFINQYANELTKLKVENARIDEKNKAKTQKYTEDLDQWLSEFSETMTRLGCRPDASYKDVKEFSEIEFKLISQVFASIDFIDKKRRKIVSAANAGLLTDVLDEHHELMNNVREDWMFIQKTYLGDYIDFDAAEPAIYYFSINVRAIKISKDHLMEVKYRFKTLAELIEKSVCLLYDAQGYPHMFSGKDISSLDVSFPQDEITITRQENNVFADSVEIAPIEPLSNPLLIC